MDSEVWPTMGVLAVVMLGCVIAAFTRLKHLPEAEDEPEVAPIAPRVPPATKPPPKPVRERSSSSRMATGIAIAALIGCVALGFVVYDQGRKMRDAEAVLDRKLDDAEQRLSSLIAVAIAKVPDVDAVKRDLDALETKLFGFSTGGFERNVVGGLRSDVDSLEASVSSLDFDLSGFKSCMNRAVSNAFDSYDRAANSYFGGGTYYVPRCY